jgi:hypothetical protein
MQNPFRHDDPHHPDRGRDEPGREARDRRPDEYRTWGGGDGGRTAEAFRREDQSYAPRSGPAGAWTQDAYQQGRGGPGGWTGDQGEGYAGPGGYATGARSYGGGPQYGRDDGGPGYGSQDPRGSGYAGSYRERGYGERSHGRRHQAGPAYASGRQDDHGYAPGGQIWQGSGRGMGGQTHEHHDFEPDYLHWREQQLSAFDKDYSDWRNERRQKFSSDFDDWRRNRPRSEASGDHTPAENPIVGDVSDGGVGSAEDAKKR